MNRRKKTLGWNRRANTNNDSSDEEEVPHYMRYGRHQQESRSSRPRRSTSKVLVISEDDDEEDGGHEDPQEEVATEEATVDPPNLLTPFVEKIISRRIPLLEAWSPDHGDDTTSYCCGIPDNGEAVPMPDLWSEGEPLSDLDVITGGTLTNRSSPAIASNFDYLVKFQGLSYGHSRWLPHGMLVHLASQHRTIKNRISHFSKKLTSVSARCRAFENERLQEWQFVHAGRVERVLDSSCPFRALYPDMHLVFVRNTQGTWKFYCMKILQALVRFRKNGLFYASPFLRPVDEERDSATDYYSIVKKPMDISTIQAKLYLSSAHSSIYEDPSIFWGDVKQIFLNARLYNGDSSAVAIQSKVLEALFDKLFGEFTVLAGKVVNLNNENAAACASSNQRFVPTSIEEYLAKTEAEHPSTKEMFPNINPLAPDTSTSNAIQHIRFNDIVSEEGELYLVKWAGLSYVHATWELDTELHSEGIDLLISQFHRREADNNSHAYIRQYGVLGPDSFNSVILNKNYIEDNAFVKNALEISLSNLDHSSSATSQIQRCVSEVQRHPLTNPRVMYESMVKLEYKNSQRIPVITRRINAGPPLLMPEKVNSQPPPVASTPGSMTRHRAQIIRHQQVNSASGVDAVHHDVPKSGANSLLADLLRGLSPPDAQKMEKGLRVALTDLTPSVHGNHQVSAVDLFRQQLHHWNLLVIEAVSCVDGLYALSPVDSQVRALKLIQRFFIILPALRSLTPRQSDCPLTIQVMGNPPMTPFATYKMVISSMMNCVQSVPCIGTVFPKEIYEAMIRDPIVVYLSNQQRLSREEVKKAPLSAHQPNSMTTSARIVQPLDQSHESDAKMASEVSGLPEGSRQVIPLPRSSLYTSRGRIFSAEEPKATWWMGGDGVTTAAPAGKPDELSLETPPPSLKFEPAGQHGHETPEDLPYDDADEALGPAELTANGYIQNLYTQYKARAATAESDSHSAATANSHDQKEPRKSTRSYQISPQYKNKLLLYPHQLSGLNWLIDCWANGRSTILADEMGLGKTIQTMAFLHHLYSEENIRGPFLVVAPLSTLEHWRVTAEKWTDMNAILYYDEGGHQGRNVLRQFEWFRSTIIENVERGRLGLIPAGSRSPPQHPLIAQTSHYKFNCLITSFETFQQDIDILGEIRWSFVIIDEAHKLKNKDSKIMKTFKSMYVRNFCLLTGTFVQNNIEEMWPLLNIIEPVKFCNSEEFSRQFGDLTSQHQVHALTRLLRPHLLRRVKEDIATSIPPLEETIIDVEMTLMQKAYYRAIFERNLDQLKKMTTSSRSDVSRAVPRLMNIEMELRKCCNHPYMMDGIEAKMRAEDATEEEKMVKMIKSSGKTLLLEKLLVKFRDEGRKVLIFSQFNYTLTLLEDLMNYKSWQYERLDGSIRGLDRSQAINRFNDLRNDCFCFLLSTRAGGLGINLTSADTVIIYDSDWNPQNDVQAVARAHRIGQEKHVKMYRLITARTYEAEMFSRASRKLGLNTAVFYRGAFGTENGESSADPDTIGSDLTGKAPSKKEIENLLKHGAYYLMENDSTERAQQFESSTIEDILNRNSRLVTYKLSGKDSTFAKTSFKTEEGNVDMDDPDFWEKVTNASRADRRLLSRLNEGSCFASESARAEFLSDLQSVAEQLEDIYTKDAVQALNILDTLTQVQTNRSFNSSERSEAAEWLLSAQEIYSVLNPQIDGQEEEEEDEVIDEPNDDETLRKTRTCRSKLDPHVAWNDERDSCEWTAEETPIADGTIADAFIDSESSECSTNGREIPKQIKRGRGQDTKQSKKKIKNEVDSNKPRRKRSRRAKSASASSAVKIPRSKRRGNEKSIVPDD
eukprot:GHVH01005694.1.p1 GENE.GHVH01005694.1~~GHVH01005694.1.p1  ORF type:complete len:1832 (-),score=267.34 GHVH01005694.1:206-5701(-)